MGIGSRLLSDITIHGLLSVLERCMRKAQIRFLPGRGFNEHSFLLQQTLGHRNIPRKLTISFLFKLKVAFDSAGRALPLMVRQTPEFTVRSVC